MATWIAWVELEAPDMATARRRLEHALVTTARVDRIQSKISYQIDTEIDTEERQARERARRRLEEDGE